jgi:hypothetical protein
VRYRGREIWPTKHLTHAQQGYFTCRKSTTWDRLCLGKKCALRITNLEKLTKSGVKRSREALSLPSLDHFCVRKVLLETVNGALNYDGGTYSW